MLYLFFNISSNNEYVVYCNIIISLKFYYCIGLSSFNLYNIYYSYYSVYILMFLS